MISHRIIDILKTFSKKDIINFKDFLNSPYFNKSEKIKRLYDYLIKFYPHFSSSSLTKESVHKKISNNSPYNNSTILNLLADISYHAENYLKLVNFQKKEIKARDFLIDELFKRNLGKLIGININKSKELLRADKNIDADYYMNNFKITTDELNHINVNKARAKNFIINLYIDKLTVRGMYLTYFYISEIIAEYDDLLALDKTFLIKKESNFVFNLFKKIDFQEVLNFLIANCKNQNYSLIFQIYYNLLMAFSTPENDKFYFTYKKLFLSALNLFSLDEARFHFGKLVRYCKNKSSIEKKYEIELLNLYNYILNKGYYKSSITDYLPVELFRTILLLGLKLRKYKWVESFIVKFRNKLHPERRKNMYYYGLSVYYFERGIYAKTMYNFHKIDLNHFMIKLDIKNIMLMTYFELNEFESAFSLIDTYKHFLTNDKTLSTLEYNLNKNFINIVYKMILYKTKVKHLNKYLIEMELKKDASHKEWLIEKFRQL